MRTVSELQVLLPQITSCTTTHMGKVDFYLFGDQIKKYGGVNIWWRRIHTHGYIVPQLEMSFSNNVYDKKKTSCKSGLSQDEQQ